MSNIPILGQKTETIPFEPYDSEILIIEKVLNRLNERARGQARNYAAFQDEIHERFNDVGFLVDVKWFETNIEGVKMPEISVIGRVETEKQKDHDRMRHEITNDILELGSKGIIKADAATVKAALGMERAHKDH